MILIRLKGSVTPLRLTTASTASSTVVNRLPHSGHDRRRRINWPSSASRESTTRESACRQYGHRTECPPVAGRPPRRRRPGHAEPRRHHDRQIVTPCLTCGGDGSRNPNLWMTYSL